LQRQLDADADLLIDWRIDQAGSGSVLVSFAGAALGILETVRAISVGGNCPDTHSVALFHRSGRKFECRWRTISD
jgi:hypothetical protein